MKIFEYKNISKTLIFATIAIIVANSTLISMLYYTSQIKELESTIEQLRINKINEKKETIKKDIMFQIVMLRFKYEKDLPLYKKEIKNYFRQIPFDKEKSDYIFIYELLNKHGGDKFAKLVLNPNRKDLEGKLISSYYQDKNGFKFREKFLQGINNYGESFVTYTYSKTNNTIAQKISYFYYIKELNWVIAKGIYIDDIQKELNTKKRELKKQILNIVSENIFFFLLFTSFWIFIAYMMGKKVSNTLKEKDVKVNATTNELTKLNMELDERVKKEIIKNNEKEQLLMQKSKFIALGEMISLIAHQWRQPISEIGAIVMNIKMHKKMKKLDNEILNKKTKDIENLLEYMSQTIDDFRFFFKPNKKKQAFFIEESIARVLKIVHPMLSENKINIETNIDTTIKITNYQNELEQVLLNLISNAKDALVIDRIKKPLLIITLEQKDKIYLSVKDNANGVKQEIQDKIFDPYFTTKEEADGTGIGLYMSKTIIEKNLQGQLVLESSKEGTCFTIKL
jgi:C4-dicarboxylate-specific signal transduction histidine kinase